MPHRLSLPPGAPVVLLGLPDALGRALEGHPVRQTAADADPREVVEDLGRACQVVAVVRRLDRHLLGRWRAEVELGGTTGLDEWLARDARDELVSLLERWLPVVPPDAFWLVVAADDDPVLSAAEVDVVRRLNTALRNTRDWTTGDAALVRQAVLLALRDEGGVDRDVVLTGEAYAEVRRRADAQARAVEGAGVHVAGGSDVLRLPATAAGSDGSLTPERAAAAVAAAVLAATGHEDRHRPDPGTTGFRPLLHRLARRPRS